MALLRQAIYFVIFFIFSMPLEGKSKERRDEHLHFDPELYHRGAFGIGQKSGSYRSMGDWDLWGWGAFVFGRVVLLFTVGVSCFFLYLIYAIRRQNPWIHHHVHQVWMNLFLPALVIIYCQILPERRSGAGKLDRSTLLVVWHLGRMWILLSFVFLF